MVTLVIFHLLLRPHKKAHTASSKLKTLWQVPTHTIRCVYRIQMDLWLKRKPSPSGLNHHGITYISVGHVDGNHWVGGQLVLHCHQLVSQQVIKSLAKLAMLIWYMHPPSLLRSLHFLAMVLFVLKLHTVKSSTNLYSEVSLPTTATRM